MPSNLAPVYLDDNRVQLQGDPRPPVSKIVAASGKPAADMRVVRVKAPGATEGDTLQFQDIIERSEQGAPVYLRLIGNNTDVNANAKETFGAGRTGIAGQGATGSPGNLPADKQAKSDFEAKAGSDRGGGGARRGERPQPSREGAVPEPSSDPTSDAD